MEEGEGVNEDPKEGKEDVVYLVQAGVEGSLLDQETDSLKIFLMHFQVIGF